jgi:hypothetical protein
MEPPFHLLTLYLWMSYITGCTWALGREQVYDHFKEMVWGWGLNATQHLHSLHPIIHAPMDDGLGFIDVNHPSYRSCQHNVPYPQIDLTQNASIECAAQNFTNELQNFLTSYWYRSWPNTTTFALWLATWQQKLHGSDDDERNGVPFCTHRCTTVNTRSSIRRRWKQHANGHNGMILCNLIMCVAYIQILSHSC